MRSLFTKWAIQNNSDALAATHIKWKNGNNSTGVNFNSITLIDGTFPSWVVFNLVFKPVHWFKKGKLQTELSLGKRYKIT